MRPQRAPATKRPVSQLVALAAGAVVAGVLFFAAVVALLGSGEARSKLGSDLFTVGKAAPLEGEVTEQGPLVFQALVGERDLFVHHVSGRWLAFETTAPGAARRCQLEWRQKEFAFVDPCDKARYAADGAGLVHYRTVVDSKGVLKVDLRRAIPPTTTTTTPTTTTTAPPAP